MQATPAQIQDWREAGGAYACFAIPYPPFYLALPLLFWVLRRGEAETEIVGAVAWEGRIRPVDEVEVGSFWDYYRPREQPKEEIEQLVLAAAQRGERLYQAHFPQARRGDPSPAPAPSPEPVPEASAPPSRRRRRRRRPTQESITHETA